MLALVRGALKARMRGHYDHILSADGRPINWGWNVDEIAKRGNEGIRKLLNDNPWGPDDKVSAFAHECPKILKTKQERAEERKKEEDKKA